jgi:hypothetical protein
MGGVQQCKRPRGKDSRTRRGLQGQDDAQLGVSLRVEKGVQQTRRLLGDGMRRLAGVLGIIGGMPAACLRLEGSSR